MKYLKKPKYPPEQVTDEIRQTVSTILSDVEQNGRFESRRQRSTRPTRRWNPKSRNRHSSSSTR